MTTFLGAPPAIDPPGSIRPLRVDPTDCVGSTGGLQCSALERRARGCVALGGVHDRAGLELEATLLQHLADRGERPLAEFVRSPIWMPRLTFNPNLSGCVVPAHLPARRLVMKPCSVAPTGRHSLGPPERASETASGVRPGALRGHAICGFPSHQGLSELRGRASRGRRHGMGFQYRRTTDAEPQFLHQGKSISEQDAWECRHDLPSTRRRAKGPGRMSESGSRVRPLR